MDKRTYRTYPYHCIFVDELLTTKTLPMQYRKELLLIYKEAIKNIAKHANATRVAVSLKNGNRYINYVLPIMENGKVLQQEPVPAAQRKEQLLWAIRWKFCLLPPELK